MTFFTSIQQKSFALGSRLAPRLAAEFFYRTWGRTKRYPLPENEVATIESATRRKLTLGQNQIIETYRWGQGPVALLVHGWHGRASQYWEVIEHLRLAGYKVVAFDAPAHGLSSGVKSDLPQMTAAVERVANQYEAIELVVAHSFGCLATARAIANGCKVNRVNFVAAPQSLRRATEGVLDTVGMSPRARAIFADLLELGYGRDIWQKYDFEEIGAELGRLAEVTVIHDLDDREVPWQQGKKVSDSIPGSRFLATNDLGHRRILRSKRLCELIDSREAGFTDIATRVDV